ncbi:MAG: hypothetical protein HC869_02230 [Rhodospirillales bacterium]|nr:hypothetical protein [Rhodospirillales bacterium]
MLTTATARQRKAALKGWHVLSAFVLFFAAVLAVNVIMIYSAVSTYSGVVAAEPFRKGLHYNDRIVANDRQLQLRWLDTLTMIAKDASSSQLRTPTGSRSGASASVPSLAVHRQIGKMSNSSSLLTPQVITKLA